MQITPDVSSQIVGFLLQAFLIPSIVLVLWFAGLKFFQNS